MKDYIVGSELRLNEILESSEVMPMLKAMVTAGVRFASVTDNKGQLLWSEGDSLRDGKLLLTLAQDIARARYEGNDWKLSPLYHEGEPVGFLFAVMPDSAGSEPLSKLIEMASATFNLVIKNNAKRILTSTMHDTVMRQSYEELLDTNKRLSISEQRYRELALNLEQRVEEKTAELKKAVARLLEQEKMASIGQLAAGIAHEINNPISFIYSNLNSFTRYVNSMKEMIQSYRKSFSEIGVTFTEIGQASCLTKEGKDVSLQSAAHDLKSYINAAYLLSEDHYKRLKIDFITGDVFDLIRQSIDGAERIRRIVANLKDFSHIDESANRRMDINKELENTISVLSSDIKTKSARIINEYGEIADTFGNPGLVSQVFLNILLNALQSRDDGLVITIKTEQKDGNIMVSIADNGKGIPPEIQNRIFEPFFTTKDVGKGTGMGLAVVYDIVSKHGGTIEVKSKVNEGSNFIIILPVNSGT